MSEHTWTISIQRDTYTTVELTEAELVDLCNRHGLSVPGVFDLDSDDYMTSWTDAMYEAVSSSQDAMAELLGHRSAEEQSDELSTEELSPSDATTEDEDEAWRPASVVAWTTAEPEPVAAGTGEWWR